VRAPVAILGDSAIVCDYVINPMTKVKCLFAILPHLFQDDIQEQRITINRKEIGEGSYNALVTIAKPVGFIETSN